MGLDEAVFLQPIAIGDLVTFTARVVHCTANTCRVFVTVEVRDPSDAGRLPTRSNRLIFVFALEDGTSRRERRRRPPAGTVSTSTSPPLLVSTAGAGPGGAGPPVEAVQPTHPTNTTTSTVRGLEAAPCWWLLPQTYPEWLMHLEGKRRSDSEGPTDAEARDILAQAVLAREDEVQRGGGEAQK